MAVLVGTTFRFNSKNKQDAFVVDLLSYLPRGSMQVWMRLLLRIGLKITAAPELLEGQTPLSPQEAMVQWLRLIGSEHKDESRIRSRSGKFYFNMESSVDVMMHEVLMLVPEYRRSLVIRRMIEKGILAGVKGMELIAQDDDQYLTSSTIAANLLECISEKKSRAKAKKTVKPEKIGATVTETVASTVRPLEDIGVGNSGQSPEDAVEVLVDDGKRTQKVMVSVTKLDIDLTDPFFSSEGEDKQAVGVIPESSSVDSIPMTSSKPASALAGLFGNATELGRFK